MGDRDKKSTGNTKPASDLLDIAAQLAALAEEITALAKRPLEQPSTSSDTNDETEASSE
ncbi:hypothetical protein M728_000960 [Ensifer sp. WSM1721]|uniref:hypothetical protein n=1 Tax=Ensifer sp. WSM1721 TaxID=1041159 RepID=UPI0004AF8161|nr:hypothetical protein [Ensifer sp. WSM1721]